MGAEREGGDDDLRKGGAVIEPDEARLGGRVLGLGILEVHAGRALRKPFGRDALLAVVRELLGPRPLPGRPGGPQG